MYNETTKTIKHGIKNISIALKNMKMLRDKAGKEM
jgi:hypothetical protein